MAGAILALTQISSSRRVRTEGIVLLPMSLPTIAFPTTPGIIEDSENQTFRIGRESRPARVVAGSQTIKRSVRVPPGGARFETVIAPLQHGATVQILIDGRPLTRAIVAPPGKWTPIVAELPATPATVMVEERVVVPTGSPILWSDDRIAPNAGAGRPDVLIVSLDTVRLDYLTPYASEANTTPELMRLAREGTRFDQAVSVSSWTMPAHAALLTGLFPSLDLGFSRRLEAGTATMAEIFAAAGYTCHGASGGPYTDATFGFQQGFRSYLDSGNWKNAREITDWATEHVTQATRGAPLFMFLNYFDAHEPNSGMTADEWHALDSGREALTAAKTARLQSAYRDDLRAIDGQLTRLFDAFRRVRDWSNTIVIVVGDHGQLLGDRGRLGHGLTLDEELVHVPLIVKGAVAGSLRRAAYVEQIQLTDVFSLVLELAGLSSDASAPISARIRRGQPIRNVTFFRVKHEPSPALRAMPRWQSAVLHGARTDSIKIVVDDTGRTRTFRIAGIHEQEIPSSSMTSALVAEVKAMINTLPGDGAPGTLVLSKDVLDRLRSLGYIR